jgi:hypothetical protein
MDDKAKIRELEAKGQTEFYTRARRLQNDMQYQRNMIAGNNNLEQRERDLMIADMFMDALKKSVPELYEKSDYRECPYCGTEMKFSVGTSAEMREYFCIKCHYREIVKK